ncbi:hypothetical protein ACERJO_17010 [Halalkalibacter sp. AB-rgal2]|uniref:hypothetical protein n=1 Tax=Halalkalibacter sp. AB-rgal2 TaxID=3242695 RepID=UPI00359E16DF
MVELLNIGSLVLGLIAWILPIVTFIRMNNLDDHSVLTLIVTSISACAISLCFQIFSINHLVTIEDWSALMDIMDTLAFVVAVLLIVTIILNVINLLIYRHRLVN